MSENAFTPALGRLAPVRFYDHVVALTRERLWRALTAAHVAPGRGEVIVDVGCGTGSLALLLARVEPRASIVGVDPDPDVLAAARKKAGAAGISGAVAGESVSGKPAAATRWSSCSASVRSTPPCPAWCSTSVRSR